MRQRLKTITAGAMLPLALILGGCGSSDPSTPEVAKVTLSSPAIASDGPIPAAYTCDGKNVSPPLEWGAVPAGTGELALFVLGFTPSPSNPNSYKASVEWAVAGVNPDLHKLAAGALPAGAHLGTNSDKKKGYSICPKKGTTKQYQFELYAVSADVGIASKFVGLSVVAALANPKSSSTPATLGHGGFAATYKRAG